ncbi:MAG: hypothetical protein GX322_05840 [Firmicutes bacterium]|nr:hypothetical protein [Bacillota bacterium]
MREKYREIMDELDYITTHEGFVETCLDLRDSMYFYDKGLILAGYAGSVEMLMSFAMFWAVLEAPERGEEIFDEIADITNHLETRLRADEAAMDIVALVETFLQTTGWVVEQRYVVFREMFEAYMTNAYSATGCADELLRQAQLWVEKDNAKAAKLVGQVGAMALRGVEVRPVWFYIARPRLQMWLRGVLGAIQNFAAAAHFSFPVDSVERERQKWRSDAPRPVVDLRAFRNLRYPMMPTDTPEVLRRGELDDDLLQLFAGGPLDKDTMHSLVTAGESIKDVLLAILETEELGEEDAPGEGWALANVIRLLSELEYPETVAALLGLLGRIRPGSVLYNHVKSVLVDQPETAGEAALEKLKAADVSVQEALALIDLLNQIQPARVYPALVGVLDKAVSWEEKLAVARSLLDTGDVRAIPHLRRLGASMSNSPYGGAVKEFLSVATRQLRASQVQKRRV